MFERVNRNRKTTSVLLPVFNGQRSVADALSSIIEGSRIPDEVICVDDGSTDGTLGLLQQYERKYGFIKVIRSNINLGLGNALNLGLKHCASDIVIRCDADDLNAHQRVESIMFHFENDPNLDIVCSWAWNSNKSRVLKTPIRPFELLSFSMVQNPIIHPSVAFKRRFIELMGGYPPLKTAQDYALWCMCLRRGANIHVINRPLISYNRGLSSITSRLRSSQIINHREISDHQISWAFPTQNISPSESESLRYYLVSNEFCHGRRSPVIAILTMVKLVSFSFRRHHSFLSVSVAFYFMFIARIFFIIIYRRIQEIVRVKS